MNPIYTLSSISTAKENIKLIATYVYFGNINSTKSSIQRSIKSSMMKKANQFAQLWAGQVNDYKKFKNLFVKYLKEQTPH